MTISKEDKTNLEPFIFENGKNSYFCKTFDKEGNPILLKFFNGTDEEIKRKVDIIRPLEKIKYDGINAFAKELISIDGIEKGYSCNYFKKASNFLEKKNIPYYLRWKATLDTTDQLKFLHKNGYIVNDIRLNNHMICPVNNCGFLIDFEDMMFEDDKIPTPAYYRFYKKGYDTLIPPSKKEDVKKQLICHLSVLLEQDFELFVIYKDEWQLLEKFSFQKEIYEFMETVWKGQEIIYFDEISSLFKSEEVVKDYQKILKRKI